MFEGLTDAELASLVTQLRSATLALAMGQQVAEIRYGDHGEKFHPADAKKTEDLLNRAIAEQQRRNGTCVRPGAIFPVTG